MIKGLIDAAVNMNIELGRRVNDITPGGFNVFEITGIERKEVMMCRFLHELLSPKGSHGMGRLFLREFFEEVLKLNIDDEVLVQIDKEAVGTKGPRVTLSLSMPGRRVVLLPNSRSVGVSHKVSDEDRARRRRSVPKRL